MLSPQSAKLKIHLRNLIKSNWRQLSLWYKFAIEITQNRKVGLRTFNNLLTKQPNMLKLQVKKKKHTQRKLVNLISEKAIFLREVLQNKWKLTNKTHPCCPCFSLIQYPRKSGTRLMVSLASDVVTCYLSAKLY